MPSGKHVVGVVLQDLWSVSKVSTGRETSSAVSLRTTTWIKVPAEMKSAHFHLREDAVFY